MTPNLDKFIDHYTETIFFTDFPQEDLKDYVYGPVDLSPEAKQQIREDCRDFITRLEELNLNVPMNKHPELAYDFWFTRNGHGAGFWDGDWPCPLGNRLAVVAVGFPELSPYVGDDGLIYF